MVETLLNGWTSRRSATRYATRAARLVWRLLRVRFGSEPDGTTTGTTRRDDARML